MPDQSETMHADTGPPLEAVLTSEERMSLAMWTSAQPERVQAGMLHLAHALRDARLMAGEWQHIARQERERADDAERKVALVTDVNQWAIRELGQAREGRLLAVQAAEELQAAASGYRAELERQRAVIEAARRWQSDMCWSSSRAPGEVFTSETLLLEAIDALDADTTGERDGDFGVLECQRCGFQRPAMKPCDETPCPRCERDEPGDEPHYSCTPGSCNGDPGPCWAAEERDGGTA